ncbi:helix-turn-helix transcriptional regulator [Phenylobacterium sp.]|uniref:helix-turn-helix transcriptional regulator n=1 Tax=Phenylobacterium sp. TaxID=1871053 RepID=UPI0025CD6176|nr:helix-turn-helix transcriptional regulator [Phenylobacterium sp.]
MSSQSVEFVHALWDELSDFDVSRCAEALDRLMARLCDLGGVWNATWAGAIRMSREAEGDLLRGWRVAQVRSLHPLPPPAHDGHFQDILRLWDRREIDPSFLLPMRDVGVFRTYGLRRDLPPAWFTTPFYKKHYGAVGIVDAAFVAFPLSPECESHFGFYSRKPIDAEALERLAYALRGIKWFHRQVLLSHGLLLASAPLTATEQKVLQLLLTDAPEKHIAHQLGLAASTTHQHVVAIYRKFGIRSRAALMSLWLSPRVAGAAALEHPTV